MAWIRHGFSYFLIHDMYVDKRTLTRVQIHHEAFKENTTDHCAEALLICISDR